MYSFLSGGTGTPKLLQGFRKMISDDQISVICNTGDDLSWNGLHVSPDLDTVLYLFSGRLDLDKFWGVADETFNALDTLKSLDYPTWFQIGDRDLGLHIFRKQRMIQGHTLTQISNEICKKWEISAEVIPMSDNSLTSMIHTSEGKLSFQEYFVKFKYQPEVEKVTYEGNKKILTEAVQRSIKSSDRVIIGPSNPVTSIGPILAINPIRELLNESKAKVIAISPIVGESAFSGPSVKLMKAEGIPTSVVGLAKHYQSLISTLVISPEDRKYVGEIEDLGIEVMVQPIILQNLDQKVELASTLIESW